MREEEKSTAQSRIFGEEKKDDLFSQFPRIKKISNLLFSEAADFTFEVFILKF